MNQKIRTLVKTLYDVQEMRIRSSNRLKKKKDGTAQAITEINIEAEGSLVMNDVLHETSDMEKKLLKEIAVLVKAHPLWKEFLEEVKGCGPLMAAVILSEYDIIKAETVSKLWQFTGLNPGMVRGNKASGSKKDGTFKLIKSDEMVRGDKKTKGFLCPFNSWLRTKMIGVLAGGFLKARSPYKKYYDDYKARLKQEEGWKEKSKGHRDAAAKRYMIKMFLKDLYVAWRTLEGLTVREPYAEEYLGKKHSA